MNLSHKLKFPNSYLCATWWWKPQILWSNIIRSLKYLRSVVLVCKDRDYKIRVCGSIPLLTFRGNLFFFFLRGQENLSNQLLFKVCSRIFYVRGLVSIYSVMLGQRISFKSVFYLIYIFLVNFSGWDCLLIYFS